MQTDLQNNEVILATQEPLLPKVRGDKMLRLNISRNTLIAFIISILIHIILLIAALPKIDKDEPKFVPPPIQVTLAPPVAEIIPFIPPPPPAPEPPTPKAKTPKVMTQKSKPNVKPSFTMPDEPEPKVDTKPEVKTPKIDAPPAKDMAEYIKMQQDKRQSAESDAARQNAEAVAAEIGPTAEQVRDERIKKNLEGGSGGIFSVTNVSTREATLKFNGWKNFSAPQVRSYLVVASGGQDIRRMVVKKAISLIRVDYPNEFPWESRILARTVTKSSKIADNAELEAFLMIEFSDMYRN